MPRKVINLNLEDPKTYHHVNSMMKSMSNQNFNNLADVSFSDQNERHTDQKVNVRMQDQGRKSMKMVDIKCINWGMVVPNSHITAHSMKCMGRPGSVQHNYPKSLSSDKKTELAWLTNYFERKMDEGMDATESNDDDMDGQYLMQLLDIAQNLQKLENDDPDILKKLLYIRWQLDSIKKDFEGSVNVKTKLDKILVLTNNRIKQFKHERKEEYEDTRQTLKFELSPETLRSEKSPTSSQVHKFRQSKAAIYCDRYYSEWICRQT